MDTRVRFAPSPTGYVHIGSLRTALYDFLYAKGKQGKYILRIEDTDRSRFVEGALENLIKSLEWAGVKHDEGVFLENGKIVQKGNYGPYIQSERLDLYKEYINKLLDKGLAYRCFCSKERLDKVREEQKKRGDTPMYDKHCRGLSQEEIQKNLDEGKDYVIRLKIPEDEDVKFKDLIRGDISINSKEIDDQVLIKSDGFPTYHFAVVVDDHLMKISHVIRGEEWLTSTPKQVILYNYFGWEVPEFVHLPTVLNKDKKKLSKRQGDVSVSDFKDKGYLPEALVNYLALVGWSPKGNNEIFSMEELINEFSFENVSKTGGVFDVEKLNWVNSQYLKNYDNEKLYKLIKPFVVKEELLNEEEYLNKKDWLIKIIDLVKEKISYLEEIDSHIKMFMGKEVNADDEVKEVLSNDGVRELIHAFIKNLEAIEEVDEEFNKNIFKKLQKETGAKGKNLYMPLRGAVTGQLHGPDMGKTFIILGKENIIDRLNYTLKKYTE
jgi:nondiscriminating glutamyl-tRNA synthetase